MTIFQASLVFARPSDQCIISKAIYSIEENQIGVRIYQVDKCKTKIVKQMFNDSIKIDVVSKIFDGKKIIIQQDFHDLIIQYFTSMIQKNKKFRVNQQFILISDFIRYAENASSFINNVEKATKIKVYDKTAEQTVEMVIFSIINNLKNQPDAASIIQGELTLFNLTKQKILIKNFNQDFKIGQEFSIENFSSLSLEKFIKKDFFQWTLFSKNKSVNPIGKEKVIKIIDTYERYLKNKIPENYMNTNTNQTDDTRRKEKKYTHYTNRPDENQKKEISNTLIVSGTTILNSLEALKIRGTWLRRDLLEKKILEFSEMNDRKIPATDAKFAVINMILLNTHMKLMGFEKAYIQESNFEEGFLLHPDYH